MNLDLRGRLDGVGKRHGKVISYKHSEARVLEVMENVCANMTDYTITKQSDGTRKVVKINNTGGKAVTITGSMTMSEHETRELRNQCGLLVEEAEDGLMAWVQKEGANCLRTKLCVEIAGVCPSKEEEVCVPSYDAARPVKPVQLKGRDAADHERSEALESATARAPSQRPSDSTLWAPHQVAEWAAEVDQHAFGPLGVAIKENDISGSVLHLLTSDELKELGLQKVGPRMRLLRAIKHLKEDL